MAKLIAFLMSNFTLTIFVLSIIFITIALIREKKKSKTKVIDIIFSYFILFNIGISYIYNFIMHVFFGDIAAKFIGWAQSPFQLEVGFASLGFGVIGILAFWASLPFRAATIVAPAMFLWGAASGHIYQMIIHHNFSPGNAGIIFWTDILMPIAGFILLWLQYKNSSAP